MLHLEASRDADELRGRFEAADLARIVVPDDGGPGAVVIHEVVGRLRLAGRVGGRTIDLDARAMFEFLRSTA